MTEREGIDLYMNMRALENQLKIYQISVNLGKHKSNVFHK